MIKATWHGHGCFLIDFGDQKVILDPFLSGSPTADIKPSQVEADFILLTHGHGDHLGDTEEIARRTGLRRRDVYRALLEEDPLPD